MLIVIGLKEMNNENITKEVSNEENSEPPSIVDIVARGVSAFGLLCREVSGYLNRCDTIRYLHSARLCRCYFNLSNFRAKEQG